MKRIVLAILLSCAASLAFAAQPQATTPNVYRNLAEETRFHALASTLRCVMCQNESLADSDAPIAHDLRHEILELMRQGKSDAQIRDFLVARYGEFVLYKPRVEPATWLLWFGPLALFAIGGATVVFIVRRRATRLRAQAPMPDSPVESSEDW
jgi:cytochrome c-type biogenesis protein CcmH